MMFRFRGGQVRPPRLQCNKNLRRAFFASLVLGLALTGGQAVNAQVFYAQNRRTPRLPRTFVLRPPRARGFRAPRIRAARPAKPFLVRPTNPQKDSNANIKKLLHKMIRPTINYSGEQVTEITEQRSSTSQQRIWGDMQGRIRREYTAPAELSGDIMLTMPNQYRYFHRRSNTLDVALWPTDFNEHEKRLFEMVRDHKMQINRVGEEIIAGRRAVIIQLTRAGEGSIKFWIDEEYGIQLKNERANAAKMVSRSYLTNIALGTGAGVGPKTFDIPLKNKQGAVKINPLFPKGSRFDSLEAARDKLPFRPLEPGSLPAGFRLSGVWVFGEANAKSDNRSVLLRYSNGVSSVSIFEKRVGAGRAPAPSKPNNKPRKIRGSVQRWRMSLSNGGPVEVGYIGHLTPEQLTALHDSLR